MSFGVKPHLFKITFSLNFGGVLKGRDPQMCTFGLSGCRVKPQRGTMGLESEKKREIWAPHPTLRGPTPSHTLPHNFAVYNFRPETMYLATMWKALKKGTTAPTGLVDVFGVSVPHGVQAVCPTAGCATGAKPRDYQLLQRG